MTRWKEWLDSLNSPGGHIFVLTGLFITLLCCVMFRDPTLREVMMIFVGALGNEMRGQIANSSGLSSITTKKDEPPPPKDAV